MDYDEELDTEYFDDEGEPIKEYPDEPYVDTDALQHYNREKDMGVGRW